MRKSDWPEPKKIFTLVPKFIDKIFCGLKPFLKILVTLHAANLRISQCTTLLIQSIFKYFWKSAPFDICTFPSTIPKPITDVHRK